jgi:hypothetical protein
MTQNFTYTMSDKETVAPKVEIHNYSLISFDFPTWSTKQFPTWIDHPTRDIPSWGPSQHEPPSVCGQSIIPWYLHTSMTLWILMGQVGLTICIWCLPNFPNFHSWLQILVVHPSFQSFPNVLDSTKVCMAWMLVKMGPISHNPTIFLPDEYFQTYLSSIWFWIRSLEILKVHTCVSMSVFCVCIYISYLYFQFPILMCKSGRCFLKTHI